ncbi:hypothetical protein GCM10023094_48820 [Rhodococcus olei]|uniref:Uncharacterized protein n=1 Tax=Rhodococcus olei TaxID=2161675 RepID=A0ABP8PN23_9NOCA
MFHTGAPIGTVTVSAAEVSHAVTSTAASVGPYRLCRAAPHNRRNVSAVVGGNASPLQNTRRSPAQSSGRAADRNVASIDGTKCTVVTCSAAMVRDR